MAAFGAITCGAYALDVLGRVDDAATILVITAVYTLTFWANRRPAQFAARFGPFSRIAEAVRQSQADIAEWVRERTLLAGGLVAVGYGIAVVIGKHIVAAGITAISTPWLAAAIGLAIGAVVVAPDLWRSLLGRIRGADSHS